MNPIKQKLEEILSKAVKEIYGIEIDINLSKPPKKELGDYAFGVFLIAKETKKSPNEICETLKQNLDNNSNFSSLEIAGPFLNIRLSFDFYTNTFLNTDILELPQVGAGKKVVVDYIGTNVGKVLHIGHMCTPNNGQVFVNLFKKLGYEVIGDSHLGDWGIIFGRLIWAWKNAGHFMPSILHGTDFIKYSSTEYGFKFSEREKILNDKLENDGADFLMLLYQKASSLLADDIEEEIRQEFKLLSEGNPESVELWKNFTRYSIDAMQTQLDRLGVKAQYDIGESFYEGLGLPKMGDFPDLTYNMKDVVKELIQKGIATQNDDGSVGVIFDEKTKIPSCILQKRDGTHGYLASDLACVKYRMQNWNPEKIVYFIDQRQQLHLKQVFEISKNAGWIDNNEKQTELFHAYNGFVSLKDGAMSSRKGNIIKLGDLLDEAESRAKKIILEKREDITNEELNELSKIIGIGAIKYGYLSKSRTTDLVFDWDEFMTFEGNSSPFVSYSYVRSLNILKNSNISFDEIITHNSGTLTDQSEIDLLIDLCEYKNMVLDCEKNYLSHNLVNYAFNLTKKFNSYYAKVNIINTDNVENKILKLKLVYSFSKVIENIFEILSIKLPEKM